MARKLPRNRGPRSAAVGRGNRGNLLRCLLALRHGTETGSSSSSASSATAAAPETSRSLIEIALEVGYTSPSHFVAQCLEDVSPASIFVLKRANDREPCELVERKSAYPTSPSCLNDLAIVGRRS
jgi:AraC-like DNA-binding protein